MAVFYRWQHWSHADKGDDFARCGYCNEIIRYWPPSGGVTPAVRKAIEKHLATHESDEGRSR